MLLFSAPLLLFAPSCGNIIRQYCFAAEYALVAQPVEHLTFNQRARDSSSLERTKENPRLTVENTVLIVGFSVLQVVQNSQNVPYLCLTLEKMLCRLPYAVPCF